MEGINKIKTERKIKQGDLPFVEDPLVVHEDPPVAQKQDLRIEFKYDPEKEEEKERIRREEHEDDNPRYGH